MRLLRLVSGLAVALSYVSSAHATILPKNNLHLQDNMFEMANMTEAEFNAIINRIVDVYKPIVERIHGAKLTSNNKWTDATVNASAIQYGNDWQINMYGGLARRPEVTPDGFAMVVCHELGHHLGGFPFYGNADWAASEGQSDYFATQACARYIWSSEREQNAKSRATVDAFAKSKCDESWTTENEQNLCYRVAMAGQSLAHLLSVLGGGGVPKFNTPNKTQVSRTSTSHPEAQCRLDTYFQGGLCNVSFDKDVIPARRHPSGQVSVAAEEVAAQFSCTTAGGYSNGVRPRCWFKPELEFLGVKVGSTSMKDASGNDVGYLLPGQSYQINYALGNAAATVSQNVKGYLSASSNAVNVTKNEAEFGDIAPRETKTSSSPFEVTVNSGAQCGRAAEMVLTTTAKIANRDTTVQFKKDVMIGHFIEAKVGENATQVRIPDNNQAGISSEIVNAGSGVAARAVVNIHLSHSYPRDLRIALIAPNGVKKDIPFSAAAGEIKINATVELESVEASGSWKLSVIDAARDDVGTLNSWSLTLAQASCD